MHFNINRKVTSFQKRVIRKTSFPEAKETAYQIFFLVDENLYDHKSVKREILYKIYYIEISLNMFRNLDQNFDMNT